MNRKEEAMKRLEAIELETKELRKILDEPEEIKFNSEYFYIIDYSTFRHILLGINGRGFSWYTLHSTCQTYNGMLYETAQKAIDVCISQQCSITVFQDRQSALDYLMRK
jgi:hypothetical protein